MAEAGHRGAGKGKEAVTPPKKPKPVESCHIALGLRVRMMREMLGITQDDLCKRVGQTRVSVTNFETGRQHFLLDRVEDFARALGTTPKHLLKGIWW
jgi:DNA-binding XRE family transcriptional regulator